MFGANLAMIGLLNQDHKVFSTSVLSFRSMFCHLELNLNVDSFGKRVAKTSKLLAYPFVGNNDSLKPV